MKKMYLNKRKKIYISNRKYSFYSKRKRRISPIIIGVFLAFIVLVGAIAYSVVDSYKRNELLKQYKQTALAYTKQQDYSSALNEYNKALKIVPNNSDSKSEIQKNIVNCMIQYNKTDEAVDYVKLLIAGKELKNNDFVETALMINSVDPTSAYRLLENYVASARKIDDNVQTLIDSAASKPEIPQLDMLQGTYVKITNVRFKSTDEHFGNSIYYTTNGENPDEFSKIYRGGFPIESTSDMRVVAYNSKGESSQTGVYSFTVDKTMLDTLQNLINNAKKLADKTTVGIELNQCSQDSKDRLMATITEAENLLKQDNVLYMDAENNVDYLNKAMDEFNNRINKKVTAEQLESLLSFAGDVYNSVSKSSIANTVRTQLDELKVALDDIKKNKTDNRYYQLHQKLLALNKAGYKAAYTDLLISNSSNSYIIYDVNNDTIPELILNQGTHNENYFYTYSVLQGETVRVKSDSVFNILPKFYNHHSGLLACSTGDDNGDFYLITFINNKIEISEKLDEYNSNETLRTSLSPATVNLSSNTKPIEEF